LNKLLLRGKLQNVVLEASLVDNAIGLT
jgi:hypothetical protein